MYKTFFKLNKKLKEKGFTLVELLAVIVILAILMLIAIPVGLDVLQASKRRAFITYVDKTADLAKTKLHNDRLNGNNLRDGCYIYNLKTDFSEINTGSYKGYILIYSYNEEFKYYISLWNEDYMLVAYNYTDKINYKGEQSSVDKSVENYDSSRENELKPSFLCYFGCSECSYDSSSNDPYYSDTPSVIEGDPMKKRGATTLVTGSEFNSKVKSLVSGDLSTIKAIKRSYEIKNNINLANISISDGVSQNNPVYIWFDVDTLYFYSEATKIYLNSNSSRMFHSMVNLVDVNEFIKSVDTSRVTNFSLMFNRCSSLANLDLSSFKTNSATNMSYMFCDCYSLSSLNITSFNTSNVTSMQYMFTGCESLRILNLSHFKTNNVTNMKNMFNKCWKLNKVDLSSFNTSNVTDMSYMFCECHELTSLDIRHFDTSKVTNMAYMFCACYVLPSLDITRFNTSKVTSMRNMFNCCYALTELNISNFITSKVTDMAYMFCECYELASLDVSHFNTSNVTNMEYMFALCKSVEKLDLKTFNTSRVVNMSNMFDQCYVLADLNISNFNTARVTNMSYMFCECDKLKELNISSFNTSNVTDMSYMFFSCDELSTIYVKSFVISSGTLIELMFRLSYKLPNYNPDDGDTYMAKDIKDGGCFTTV